MMSLAVISVAALALAVVLSCFTPLNVGVLSLALAWLIGVYLGNMPIGAVMAGFPSQLFLTLTGVTLLFTMAQCNGTLGKVVHHAVRACRGRRGLVPIMLFVLAAMFASMGPGNIATAALVAPMAMVTAQRTGIPLFLMAIMVGNGANAGSLSPLAPTGVIVNGIMARSGMTGFEGQTYLYNALAHAAVAFGGYALFGGLQLFSGRTTEAVPSDAEDASTFEPRHWITLAVIAALIVGVIFAEVNVGMGAFLAAVLLGLFRLADEGEAIRKMPWRVIVMVCGVTVLVALLEKAQGIDLLVSLIARVASQDSVMPLAAFLTGIISVYSSTSGVVLPAFLPMVPGLAQQVGGADPVGLASSMNIGAHLVDVSPLSTIGALCLASAPLGEQSRVLFNQLLAWGLSMSVVGALIAYVFFA